MLLLIVHAILLIFLIVATVMWELTRLSYDSRLALDEKLKEDIARTNTHTVKSCRVMSDGEGGYLVGYTVAGGYMSLARLRNVDYRPYLEDIVFACYIPNDSNDQVALLTNPNKYPDDVKFNLPPELGAAHLLAMSNARTVKIGLCIVYVTINFIWALWWLIQECLIDLKPPAPPPRAAAKSSIVKEDSDVLQPPPTTEGVSRRLVMDPGVKQVTA